MNNREIATTGGTTVMVIPWMIFGGEPMDNLGRNLAKKTAPKIGEIGGTVFHTLVNGIAVYGVSRLCGASQKASLGIASVVTLGIDALLIGKGYKEGSPS